jgi:Tfp pilus assembly protein PilX
MRMTTLHSALSRARAQDGVTMIIAMGVMLVTSLLLASTYVATQGDIQLSHTDTAQKEAYYAAVAGVQEFEYEMQNNPDYWETCGKPTNTLPQESGSSYKVTILPASTAPTGTTECSTSNPFKTVIESSGAAANTFRVESVGTAGKKPEQHHTIIATFKVTGFLNFIYYTNHEDEDPTLYNASTECKNPNTYYPNTSGCSLIEFATGDEINGPMHTNDAVCVGGSASFGRSGHSPPDAVEFYRSLNSNCHGTGKYNTATKSFTKGELLTPPKSDESLSTYANEEDEFLGVSELVLNGLTNKITVINKGVTKIIEWPSNGLIYVGTKEACGYTFNPLTADSIEEKTGETNCGNVYVNGTYSKSLTIGSAEDVIVNGNIYPYGNLGGEPTGTATLGLIANNNVRIYHPVKETYLGEGAKKETCKKNKKGETETYNSALKECEYTENYNECDAPNLNASEDKLHGWGSLENPWIYAAILSTTHSFVVDNYNCGAKLGDINLEGALAQNYRGIVGTGGGTGYFKDYKYDGRLAVDEPPYFLSPLNAGWKVARETAPKSG